MANCTRLPTATPCLESFSSPANGKKRFFEIQKNNINIKAVQTLATVNIPSMTPGLHARRSMGWIWDSSHFSTGASPLRSTGDRLPDFLLHEGLKRQARADAAALATQSRGKAIPNRMDKGSRSSDKHLADAPGAAPTCVSRSDVVVHDGTMRD